MGLFGKLFGKADDDAGGEARCNECGMTGGRHTDWCPLVQDEGAGAPGTGGGEEPREEAPTA